MPEEPPDGADPGTGRRFPFVGGGRCLRFSEIARLREIARRRLFRGIPRLRSGRDGPPHQTPGSSATGSIVFTAGASASTVRPRSKAADR